MRKALVTALAAIVGAVSLALPAVAQDRISATHVFPASLIYADSPKDNREENIWVFDIRTEKNINLVGRTHIRAFLDLFNITNSDAAETITRTIGTNYRRPANILAPFTARVGFRFLW